MFDFHKDKKRYFSIQSSVTADYLIPFLEEHDAYRSGMHILEIGCAEAGVLKTFLEKGCTVVGIELLEGRANLAREFLNDWIKINKAEIICKNIYDIDPDKDLEKKFDLIILKDVIEHIPDQKVFIPRLKHFLNKNGKIMFGFPPWYMPFGGHQQICANKILSKLPWYHLLPNPFYKAILKWGGESPIIINELLEIKQTGISIERLKRILKKEEYKVLGEKYWLFNPIYKWKFGFTPREVPNILKQLKYLKNFYTTALYIVFEPK